MFPFRETGDGSFPLFHCSVPITKLQTVLPLVPDHSDGFSKVNFRFHIVSFLFSHTYHPHDPPPLPSEDFPPSRTVKHRRKELSLQQGRCGSPLCANDDLARD